MNLFLVSLYLGLTVATDLTVFFISGSIPSWFKLILACFDNSMFCAARDAYFVAGRAANTVIPVITTALAHSILTVAILDTI